jgi:hypothetical protein
MRIRILLALSAAFSLLGGALLTGPAHAAADTAPPRAEFVGGGAAGLEIDGYVQSDLISTDADYPLDLPAVVLPYNGSPTELSAELAGQTVGPVSAHVLRATTIGNLDGLPYAHSTASVADVAIAGTNIRAVRSECTWDGAGARASTQIVDAAGHTYAPKPNTHVFIKNVGTLVLNEQQVENYSYRSDLPDAQVITVRAAHLIVDPNPLLAGFFNTYATLDVSLAFSSCDPLKLPSLSGLKLAAPSSGGDG